METETLVTNANETAAPEVAPTSQKQAVFTFITEALAGSEVTVARLKDKSDKSPEKKEVLKSARTRLFAGIRNGSIYLSPDAAGAKNDSKLKKYCSSLINNWLGKDERFN